MSNLILPPGVESSSGPKEYPRFGPGAEVQSSDLGTPNIRTSTSHKVRKFRDQRFWAEGGRIQIVDDRTGEHTSVSIDDFGKRAVAFILQARNMQRIGFWADEFHELVKAIGEMKEVLYEAKEQGDPHDPEVLKFKMRQRGRKFTLGGMKGHHVTEGPISGRKIGKQSDAGRIYLK